MKFVPNAITRTVGRQLLTMKKNSPHIAFGAGVAGVIVGNVLVARATLKVGPVLDDMRQEIDDVKEHRPEGTPERNKDLGYVYGKNIVKLGKLYGPAILVTGVSIASLTGSHVELTRRNKALAATVVSITKAYEEYRSRVRDELGEQKERDLYYGAREHEVEDENGKKVKIVGPDGMTLPSAYARFFDEYSKFWQKDPELNRLFVQVAETHANQKLRANGHVFLNEIYDALGIPRSSEGSIVGWVYYPDDDGPGDNYIDFGLYTTHDNGFVNGWNRSVLLDFNVDGLIFNQI